MKLFILLVSLSVTCFSQVNDSLLYQLKSIENDTERVNQLYLQGFELRNTNPELSYRFAICCQQEAEKCHSKKHLAKSYNLLGVLFYKKGDYTKALKFQKHSLFLNQSVHNDYGIAINQTNLGNIYTDINYFKLAESSYLQAIQAYNKLNNKLQLTRCLINISVLKYDQKQLNAAVKQFEEALIFAQELEDQELIASCYNNIGAIYREQNKLDSSLIYLEESLKIRDLMSDDLEIADSYNNLALVYIQLKNYDKALNYITQCESICRQYEYKELEVELYDTKALFYESQKNYESALFWTKKYHQVKDSLQKINKEDQFLFMDNETPLNDKKHEQALNNQWLLISVGLLLILIPLLLIRYKR